MDRATILVDSLFKRYRWILHVFFWIAVVGFYVIFFGRKNSNYLQTFFFVGLLMPVTIGATYFLNYYLVPRYLMKERYWRFIVYFIYTLIASTYLELMIAMLTFLIMAEVNIKAMSPASFDVFFLLTSLLMVVFLGTAIKMLLHWRRSAEDYRALMQHKVEAELKFLKIQLNPHFLFNTLNNLYYLSTEKSEKAPRAILQLSEMLDYVMHSSKTEFVPLASELKQVENYVALELLRYEDRVKVTTVVTGECQSNVIGPMMLITLIENAFKHGVMRSSGASWIALSVHGNPDTLHVVISNSCRDQKAGKGIGLQNLRSQLSHLYPGKHQLDINNEYPGVFSVTLTLNQ